MARAKDEAREQRIVTEVVVDAYESQQLGQRRSAEELARRLLELPHAANSGDIYARMA
jgi:hypothetical protein